MENIRITPVNDPERTPFRSHVFISISPTSTYDRQNAVIVDACAGPVAGDKTYAQYLTDCALQDGNLELLQGSGTVSDHYASVDGSNGEKNSSNPNTLLHEQHPGTGEQTQQVVQTIQSGFLANPTVASDFPALQVISSIFDPLKQNTNENNGAVLTEQVEQPIQVVQDPTVGSTTTERKMVALNGANPTYVSIQLTVFPDSLDNALTALKTRFGLFTAPMDWVGLNVTNVKPNPAASVTDEHITDTRILVFGNVHLSLFVYKNVLVQISGNAVKDSIPKWTKTMVDALQVY